MKQIEQIEPGVKMLLNSVNKLRLIMICRDHGLDWNGTKLDLAKRIVEYRSKKFSEAWDAIAGKT